MKSESKQQAVGSVWTVAAGAVLAFIGWSALTLNEENSWDDDPDSAQQNQTLTELKTYVEENKTSLNSLTQTRLRTEQRIISKDLKKLADLSRPLTENEEKYLITLEGQLQTVQEQLDEFE